VSLHIHALDAYHPKSSFVHHLDARGKLVMAVLFIVSAALTPDGAWPAYVLLAALALSAAVASQLGVGFVYRRSAVALPFALAAVTVIFSTPGQSLFTVRVLGWDAALTDAGLTRFVSIVLKSWLSVQIAVVLTGSTPFPALLRAMRSLRVPKVLVAVFGFAYRYLFVIGDEALRMLRARAARSGTTGESRGGSLLWRARVTGGMAGSLFIRSIERSERIYDAMVARGYDGEVRSLRSPALQSRDVLVVLSFTLMLAAVQMLAHLF
jgi:cobalt/nickel transport system permease protein